MSKRPTWALGVLVVVVLATAAVRVRLLDVPIDRDEGEDAYFAQLLLQGLNEYQKRFKLVGIVEIVSLRQIWRPEAATFSRAAASSAHPSTPSGRFMRWSSVWTAGTATAFAQDESRRRARGRRPPHGSRAWRAYRRVSRLGGPFRTPIAAQRRDSGRP